jgi:hypothetical protein
MRFECGFDSMRNFVLVTIVIYVQEPCRQILKIKIDIIPKIEIWIGQEEVRSTILYFRGEGWNFEQISTFGKNKTPRTYVDRRSPT